MLVICNGAIKSGSTWLYNILFNLLEFERPPERYLTDGSRKRKEAPCIQPDRPACFLENQGIASYEYLFKNHLAQPESRDLVMACSQV